MTRRVLAAWTAAVLALTLAAGGAAAEEGVRREASAALVLEDGALLVADLYNRVIWRAEGRQWTLFAGEIGPPGADGQPISGYVDGPAESARFASPWALAVYQGGYAVSDTENHAVRLIRGGAVATAVGGGTPGLVNGGGTSARFDRPTGLAADGAGNLYIADTGNHLIRRMDAQGRVTTYAGGGEGRADGALLQARFREPTGLWYQDGVLYVADSGNHRVCAVAGGTVRTVAGAPLDPGADPAGQGARTDGPAESARFENPQGVAADGAGNLYVADTGSGAVRRVDSRGEVTTLLTLEGGALSPVSPRGLCWLGDRLLYCDAFSGAVEEVPGAARRTLLTDVEPGAWYAGAVSWAVQGGLLDHGGDGTFAPGGAATRAMAVTALYRMAGAPAGGGTAFPDVEAGAWYAPAAAWAGDSGLVSGTGSGFEPDRPVSRAELAALFYRRSGSPAGGTADLSGFADGAGVPAWAAEAMAWAVSQGILSGKDGGRLDPGGAATRAELAVILQRYAALWRAEDGNHNR